MLSFLILLPIILHLASAYPNSVFNGRELYDLAASPETFFQEANAWSAVGLYGSNRTSVCNGTSMLGGPGILQPNGYFKRYLSGLPSHDVINFRIHLILIDNWQDSDTVLVQLDDQVFSAGDIALSTPNFPSDLCGDPSYPDLGSFYIVGRVAHNASNITVKIISQVNRSADIASFGIGTVNMVFANTTLTNEEFPYDASCVVADVPILSNNCTCPSGYYPDLDDPTNCLPCNSNCAECFGSGPSQCYGCNIANGSSYVSTQCIKCNDTCTACSGPAGNQCLRCPATAWYRWDSSCPTTCDSPAYAQETIDDIEICMVPCEPQEFFLWNQTCGSACTSPLVTSNTFYGEYCKLPCGTTHFLYWNRSCISTCPFPLVNSTAQDVVLECAKPCNDTDFYYPNNGTCRATCAFPLRINVINDVQHCIAPCENSSLFYSQDTDTCVAECTSPNITQVEALFKRCITVIPPNNTNSTTETTTSSPTTTLKDSEIAQMKTVGSVLDAGSTTLTVTMTISSVLGSANPATATLAGFVKMLPYIRYMKINYPPKLQLMLNNMNSTLISFSLGPSITSSTIAKFSNYPIPTKFQEYQLHSSFIVNFYQTMTSLAIMLGIILALCVFTCISKRRPEIHSVLSGVKLMVKWNFFLMVFCSNLDGVILGSSLQLRTIHIESFLDALSLLICIGMNIVLISVLYLVFHIIRDIRRSKYVIHPGISASSEQAKTKKKWEEFQLFYKGSKDEKFIQHIFMLAYLLRACMFNLTISYLFNYPLTQAIIITLLGASMLTYMLTIRPFVSKLVLVQHCSDETIMLVVNLCMLSLAVLDHRGEGDADTRANLGNIIIYSNVVFSFTANIYLALYLYQGFRSAYLNTKLHKKKGIVSWLTALLAPFESGGMDVEVVPEKEEVPNILITPSSKPRPSIQTSTLGEVADSRRRSINVRPPSEIMMNSHSYLKDSYEINSTELLLREKSSAGLPPRSPPSLLFSSSPMESPNQRRKSNFGLDMASQRSSARQSLIVPVTQFVFDLEPSPPKRERSSVHRRSAIKTFFPDEVKTTGREDETKEEKQAEKEEVFQLRE